MAGRKVDCPACGASLNALGYKDEEAIYCPDCSEELVFIDNTGGYRPQLISIEEFENLRG